MNIRKRVITFVARFRRSIVASNVHCDMLPVRYIEEARHSGELTFTVYRRGLLGMRRWYWRVQAANNEIIAASEGYHRRIDCYKAVYTLIYAEMCTIQESSVI